VRLRRERHRRHAATVASIPEMLAASSHDPGRIQGAFGIRCVMEHLTESVCVRVRWSRLEWFMHEFRAISRLMARQLGQAFGLCIGCPRFLRV